MRISNDLTGKDFGLLRAVEPVESTKKGVIWECHCECGNTAYALASKLRKGKVVGCGCERTQTLNKLKHRAAIVKYWTPERRAEASERGKQVQLMRRQSSGKTCKIDFVESGAVYKSLEVLQVADDQEDLPPYKKIWICRCMQKWDGKPCGRLRGVRADKLAYGQTKSCGCVGLHQARRHVALLEARARKLKEAHARTVEQDPFWRKVLEEMGIKVAARRQQIQEVSEATETPNDPAHLADSAVLAPAPTHSTAA